MTRHRGSLLDNVRTPPQRVEPVPMSVGDSVQFEDTKQWWKVRAVSERYVILTAPYNLLNYPCWEHDKRGPHTHVNYCIIDWERGVRGPDDHYSVGYETDEDIAQALARLHGEVMTGDPKWPLPQIEVSHRAHSIRVRVRRVIHR